MDKRGKAPDRQKKKIPPEAWMSVSCECCLLSGRGLCDELVPRPEESYRVWCVSNVSKPRRNEEAQAHIGLSSHRKKKKYPIHKGLSYTDRQIK
jgi:hypothetical protein